MSDRIEEIRERVEVARFVEYVVPGGFQEPNRMKCVARVRSCLEDANTAEKVDACLKFE